VFEHLTAIDECSDSDRKVEQSDKDASLCLLASNAFQPFRYHYQLYLLEPLLGRILESFAHAAPQWQCDETVQELDFSKSKLEVRLHAR